MIGFKVTAKGNNRGYVRTYEGWSEGEPALEAEIKVRAAAQVVKTVAGQFVGGIPVAVIDVLTMPLQGMGSAAGQLIGRHIAEINNARAAMGLCIFDIEVAISGDFKAEYMIETEEDLAEVPKLLALLPRKNTRKEFMGENVLSAVYKSHVNYARHLYNFSNSKFDDVHKLNINIKL